MIDMPGHTDGIDRLEMPIVILADYVASAIASGARLGLFTARLLPGRGPALVTLLMYPESGRTVLCDTPLPEGESTFPSMTRRVPQVHEFERRIFDSFDLRPEGHPRFENGVLHDALPNGNGGPAANPPVEDSRAGALSRHDYEFLKVKGEGIYEIPVGPIHAGIIEPGHFRFSCLGEVIQNLEIRLGYLHRGVERRLAEVPWRRARFVAEAASTDTAVGNALAHALAIESLLGVSPPPASVRLRAVALEIERVANHVGDLSGVCADIGYAGGATPFARLRGRVLGLGEQLTGSRFMTGYIRPGGVARPVGEILRRDLLGDVSVVETEFERAVPLLLDNSGALLRMEGIGHVRRSTARDFGLVGPAGRASGVDYDVRRDFRQPPYTELKAPLAVPVYESGDVLARVQVRVDEVRASLGVLREFLALSPGSETASPCGDRTLPVDSVGLGIVEAWRGELIHLIFTGADGRITRYAVKDPSFNNWSGLAVASRRELVSDFPLCNKSFGLSYSGNDL
ncbi:MAG: hydrogenase [Capsulimonadaceae bacterium]